MISKATMLAAVLATPGATPPRVDGTRIQPGSMCYAIVQNGRTIGATLQQVKATQAGGTPAWDIIVHQRLAGGRFDMRDHFVVRRADLRPLTLDNRRGDPAAAGRWQKVHVEYGASRITGSKQTPSGTKSIDAPLDHQVWEGNLWGITFGALPLSSDARLRLPFWQYDKGFGTFIVKVTGSEMVNTSKGNVSAWVVEAGDDPARLARYLIAKRDGAELGYRAEGAEQRLGGDCVGLGQE